MDNDIGRIRHWNIGDRGRLTPGGVRSYRDPIGPRKEARELEREWDNQDLSEAHHRCPASIALGEFRCSTIAR